MLILKKSEFHELVNSKVLFLMQPNVDTLIKLLKEIQTLTTNSNFKSLMYLLSFDNITDHPLYQNWSIESNRVQCFDEIRGSLENILDGKRQK